MKTLSSLFLESVAKYKNKIVFKMHPRFRDIQWSFKDLENYAFGIGKILEENKIGYQDKVILIATNSPFWGGTFFGGLLKGCIIVPLNPQSTKEFVQRIIKETNAKIIFKSSHLFPKDTFDLKTINIDYEKDLINQKPQISIENLSETDIAEIVYTSGTTGDPKGVILTHKNIVSNVDAISEMFKLQSNDKTVSILPLFHMFEQTCGLMTVIKHGLSVMYTANPSSKEIMRCLQHQKATKILIVPEFLETILRKIEAQAENAGKLNKLHKLFSFCEKLPMWMRRILFHKVHKLMGGKLRIIASGGGALHPDTEKKWFAMGFTILQGYGLTETSPFASVNTEDHHKVGSCGISAPGVTVEVADNKEILISGPNVFSGYYRNDEKTKASFDEKHRFKTGDLGYIDKDGFLFISGRSKYVIIGSKGENIYPEDIELELKRVSGIKDAAVVGFKEDGREIVYAVLLTDRRDGVEIIEEANKNLAAYQRILAWDIWPEGDFPRSATRKIKKDEVSKWLKNKKNNTAAIETKVVVDPVTKIISGVTGKSVNIINDNTNLYSDLYLDSLMRIELVVAIQEYLDIEIPEHLITQKTTVKDLKELIQHGSKSIERKKFKTWLLSPISIFFRFILQSCITLPISWLFFKVKVEGIENIKDLNLPAIFMPNHVSYIDTAIVLRGLPLKIRNKIAIAAALDFMYKHFWYIAPIIEFVFNSYPMPRKEEDNIRPGFENTGKVLDKNFSVLLFPEGKISPDGSLQELKKGAGFLAIEMNVPIVPMLIKNVRDFAVQDNIIPKYRGTALLKFGKPMYFLPSENYEEVTQKIYEAMKELEK